MLHRLKIIEKITVPIIAGNVATSKGTLYVYDSGADGVKVGVGPGFVCETRDVAGVGIPQVTAIMNAANAIANKADGIPIIADGGIRKPGDLSKAIAAGADTVMIGSLLAGTDESPGDLEEKNGVLVKVVRGMASASAFESRKRLGDSPTKDDDYTPEGRTTVTPYKGAARKILYKFWGGLRSGMSYVGAHTIKEMQKNARFVELSPAGAEEQRRPLG